jgi:hypothetical protein
MFDIRKYVAAFGVVLCAVAAAEAGAIAVANHSFENPGIPYEPNTFMVLPYMDSWTELDVDTQYSSNTGVFLNTWWAPPTYIVNADANQVAFLGSEGGNALWQDLSATYQTGKKYRLTVGVCVSFYRPIDPLVLALYYVDGASRVDVVTTIVPETGLTPTALVDFVVDAPIVQANDAWAGKNMGVAIRSTGTAGGYWDLDNVRVMEYAGTADFTGEGTVNLEDFAKMAGEWLSCTGTTTDLTGDGCVNIEDLAIFAGSWLAGAP